MKLPQSIILVSLPLLVATSSVTLGALLKPVFSVNDLTTSASYGLNPWEPQPNSHTHLASFIYQNHMDSKITITVYELCCCCTNCAQDHITYELYNTSTEDYYTWVDFKKSFSTREDTDIIQYFFTRHGDFSLGSLLHDNVVFKENFTPVIGDTFLKRIKPNESFRFIVSKQISEDFEDHVFFIDELSLLSIVGNPVNLEHVIWEKDSITIHAEDALSSKVKENTHDC